MKVGDKANISVAQTGRDLDFSRAVNSALDQVVNNATSAKSGGAFLDGLKKSEKPGKTAPLQQASGPELAKNQTGAPEIADGATVRNMRLAKFPFASKAPLTRPGTDAAAYSGTTREQEADHLHADKKIDDPHQAGIEPAAQTTDVHPILNGNPAPAVPSPDSAMLRKQYEETGLHSGGVREKPSAESAIGDTLGYPDAGNFADAANSASSSVDAHVKTGAAHTSDADARLRASGDRPGNEAAPSMRADGAHVASRSQREAIQSATGRSHESIHEAEQSDTSAQATDESADPLDDLLPANLRRDKDGMVRARNKREIVADRYIEKGVWPWVAHSIGVASLLVPTKPVTVLKTGFKKMVFIDRLEKKKARETTLKYAAEEIAQIRNNARTARPADNPDLDSDLDSDADFDVRTDAASGQAPSVAASANERPLADYDYGAATAWLERGGQV